MLSSFIDNRDSPVIRLVQITDPHLFQQETSELLGINTQQSFQQVLDEIQQQPFHYDFVLATGDLVQDQSDEGYQRFAQMIATLRKPTFWIPGNHDFQPKMFHWLAKAPLSPLKHLLLGQKWQLILLDSQISGVPHGQLGQDQLDWLAQKLREYTERYTLLVLHHHILPTHSAWLDQHNLRNTQQFAELLAEFSHIKGILYGHIHQQVDELWQGYKVMATPSTCIQFKPDNNNFTLDTQQPGWREIELYENGEIVTQVKRIKQAQFLPNLQETGY